MVRSGQPIISRPAWYDRNPLGIQQRYYSAGGAPHTITTRWTYTVPAGKKAFVEVLQAKVRRVGAATTAGRAAVYVYLNIEGGGLLSTLFAEIISNGVGDKDEVALGQAITLKAGDQVSCATQDSSTGGTCDYIGTAKITEFDA